MQEMGLIPGSGRSPGEGKGYPLQYSCLEKPMDRGAWQPTVHGVAKIWTSEWLNSDCAEGTVCPWFLGLHDHCIYLGVCAQADNGEQTNWLYIQISFFFFFNCSTFTNVFPWLKIWGQILISAYTRCMHFSFDSGCNRARSDSQLSKICHELDWVERSLKACFREWLLRNWDVLIHNWGSREELAANSSE